MKETLKNWSEYKWQLNYCSNFLKESKRYHCNHLKITDVTEKERFWKTIKPVFTDKT